MFVYGQIIEVRNTDTEPWLRRIFSHIGDDTTDPQNKYWVASSREVSFIMSGQVPKTFETYAYARPIGIETFEVGQLVAVNIVGSTRFYRYHEMTGVDAHTVMNESGHLIDVQKVVAVDISAARTLFPQYKIEEK